MSVREARTVLLLWLVVGLSVAGVAGGVAVAGATEHDAENGTIQHVDPDEAGDSGDLLEVQNQLADRMTRIHLDCAENLSVGDVDCERLDGEYDDVLERYASVERDRTGRTESKESFEGIRENQSELVEAVAAFNRTHEEYRRAREAGEDQRADRLARKLRELSRRIEALGGNVDAQLRRLGNGTGRDTNEARRSTNATVREVRSVTATVATEAFTPTTLTADADGRTASPRSPVTIRGRLGDENGTAVSNASILAVVDGGVVATAETGPDGEYVLSYRPVTTAVGETDVEVRYRPSRSEEYVGSNATVTVDVESARPDVSMETDAERVAFGDRVVVTTEVTVDGTAAGSVPVYVFLGDERIAVGRTNEGGLVTVEGTVPATVPDGQRELRVVASNLGSALTPAAASQSVTVVQTAPVLGIESVVQNGSILVRGVLWVAGPTWVPGQEVEVSVSGLASETVVTNQRGRFSVRIPVSGDPPDGWEVSAVFDGERANIAPAEGETTAGGRGLLGRVVSMLPDDLSRTGGAALLFAVGFSALFARRYIERPDEESPAVASSEGDDGHAVAEGVDNDTPRSDEVRNARPDGTELVALARKRLDAGAASEAVLLSYGAVRAAFGDEPGDTRTHREFLADTVAGLPAAPSSALETLTEAFERARFAPTGVDDSTAEAAVEAAATCMEATLATEEDTVQKPADDSEAA